MESETGTLRLVERPPGCPFTRMLGGKKFVCTKPPHDYKYGHHMVEEEK